MILFVATVQENNKFIDLLKKQGDRILHPLYDFNSEEGKLILDGLGQTPLKYDNQWETILRKDVFCINTSDLVLYDFDNLPSEGRYLSMAVSLKKPIIGVSETMRPAPVYFSGSIISIVKPKHVLPMLTFIREHRDFIELPAIIEGIKSNETVLPDTGMPTEL